MRRVASWFLPILIVATFVGAEPALEEEGRSFVALLDNGDYAGAVARSVRGDELHGPDP